MINAVGRDIPEEILEMTGKEVFQGNHYRDGYVYKKDGPYTKCVVNNTQSKLVANIHDVLDKMRHQGRHDLRLPSSFP